MSRETPLVSVVIPAYNSTKVIAEALDSVLSQDYPALEVLVVDDGSTDGTSQVVEGYDDRVRLIPQSNKGAAGARNEGMRQAAGKYIAFLDADDIWLPGKLRHQVSYMEQHPEVALCCARWLLVFPEDTGEYRMPACPAPDAVQVDAQWSGWIYCDLLLDCEVCTITVVMRRELIDRVGYFDTTLRRGQDYDYWLRASRVTRIDRLDAPFAVYRKENFTNPSKYLDTNWELTVVQRAIDKWGASGPDGQKQIPSLIRKRLWRLKFSFGYNQYYRGRYREARDAFLAALQERPTQARTILYLVLSTLHLIRRQTVAASD